MIGSLSGKLIEKQAPYLVLDVQGIGYEIQASMQTFYQLPETGNNLSLYTHLVVREDAHLLYGFFEKRERTLFRTLIKVNGVGPKMALAVLSAMNPNEFVLCIEANDVKNLTRIPGVGTKTAERLIVEMRDRFKDWEAGAPAAMQDGTFKGVMDEQSRDAISALIALGYKPAEASKAISKVKETGLNSEELIRRSLQAMVL